MKIVHMLLGSANLESMNGVNHAVHHLASAQVMAGFPVEVWAISGSRTQAPAHPRAYELRVFPRTRIRFALDATVRAALDALRPPAWVQLHSVFIPEFGSIARRLHRQGLPYGLSPQGGYSPASLQQRALRKAAYLALLEQRLIRRATLIHAVCAAEADDVRRLSPRAEVTVVPNGVRAPVAELAAEKPPERPLFAFCGRLTQGHKGLDLLLDGFGQYRSEGGAGVLWLIGDGHDRADLERRAQRTAIADAVQFHGAAYDAEKHRKLAAIDVFVHTSRWEGLPLSCLEAAAIGKPLLVSRPTHLDTYVEQFRAGWVLPQNTPAAIADALWQCERLQRQGRLDEVGARARAMAEKSFDWNSIARELARFWLRHAQGAPSELPS